MGNGSNLSHAISIDLIISIKTLSIFKHFSRAHLLNASSNIYLHLVVFNFICLVIWLKVGKVVLLWTEKKDVERCIDSGLMLFVLE